MATVATEFGTVSIDEVVRVYNMVKRRDRRAAERRNAIIANNDELKEKCRDRARSYYDRNKEAILAKRKESYANKKAAEGTIG